MRWESDPIVNVFLEFQTMAIGVERGLKEAQLITSVWKQGCQENIWK